MLRETVRREQLLIAFPEGHAPATATNYANYAVDDLPDEEFVAHASHWADAGFVPRIRHEVDETSTRVTTVAAGFGVAVAPDPSCSLDIAGGLLWAASPRTARGGHGRRQCGPSEFAANRQGAGGAAGSAHRRSTQPTPA